MAVQITLEGQPPKYLTAPTYTLGRASDCDVLLPENDAMVSRHHARMDRDSGGQWWIVDSSTNGTYVNGEKLSGRRALQSGDQVGIGRTQMSFLSSQSAVAPSAAPARAAATTFVSSDEVQTGITSPQSPALAPTVESSLSPPVASPVRFEEPLAPLQTPLNFPVVAPSVEQPSEVFFAPSPIESPTRVMPPLVDDGQMKQCTRCRNVYPQDNEACPACGHAGFKVKSIGASTSLALSSADGVKPTPFDQAMQKSAEARPIAPSALVGSTPVAVSQTSPEVRSQGAVSANGMLGLIATGCGAAMLFSLFLPWAQIQMFFMSGSVSYAQLCQLAMKGTSQSNDLAFKAIGQEPRILLFFLPALATLVALGGAGMALMGTAGNLPAAARSVSTGMVLGIGGALGLLAAFLLFSNLGGSSSGMNLSSVLGPGFWLFTLASLAATVAGFGGGALGATVSPPSAKTR